MIAQKKKIWFNRSCQLYFNSLYLAKCEVAKVTEKYVTFQFSDNTRNRWRLKLPTSVLAASLSNIKNANNNSYRVLVTVHLLALWKIKKFTVRRFIYICAFVNAQGCRCAWRYLLAACHLPSKLYWLHVKFSSVLGLSPYAQFNRRCKINANLCWRK